MSSEPSIEHAIARVLEESRLDQGLSQAEVAARAQRAGYDVNQVKVSRVLRGTTAMNVSDALGIAQALGLRLSAILSIVEGASPPSASSVVLPSPAGSGSSATPARRRKPRPVRDDSR